MTSVAEIRRQYPQYDDVSDGDLLMGLHRKFYSDMHPRAFLNMIEGAANAHVDIKNPELKAYWKEKARMPMDGESTEDMSRRISGDLGVTSDAGNRAIRRTRDVVQGLTFGAGDEIVAGAASLLPGRDYDTELKRERQRLERGREMEPNEALVAEIAGAVTVPGAALKAGKAVTTGEKVAKVGKSAGAAGTAGAVYGFNAGEGGAQNRLESARDTGLLSAAIGGAAPVVGAKAKQIYDTSSLRRAARALAKSAPTMDELKTAASRIYAQADNVNNLSRDKFTTAADGMISQATRRGMDADLMPGAAKVSDRIEDAATKSDPNIGFREVDILRRKAQVPAGNVANKPEQSIGSQFIEGIDDFIEGVDPKLSKEIGEARDMWGRLRRSEQIGAAIERAKNTASGFENGIRIEFRKILNNQKLRRGFSADEISAMEDVVRGTAFGNIMKKLGKFGIGQGQQSNMLLGALGGAGGAAVGGPVGAFAVPLLGTLAQRASQATTRRGADIVEGLARAGGNVSAPQLSAPTQGLLEEMVRMGARGAAAYTQR